MEVPISSCEALGGLNLQRTPQICLCLREVLVGGECALLKEGSRQWLGDVIPFG